MTARWRLVILPKFHLFLVSFDRRNSISCRFWRNYGVKGPGKKVAELLVHLEVGRKPPSNVPIGRWGLEIWAFLIFDFSLEKPATRPRDRCGKEQLIYPFVTGSPGSSRVSALAPYSSGDRVGSTLSTPHAGGDLGLFVGECSSPQTDAPNDDERVRLMSLTPPP